jgi:phage terminase large subunit
LSIQQRRPKRTLERLVPRAFVPLLSPRRFKGAKGGRGSAKSHFFAESLVEDCICQHTRAACIREVQASIADSVKQLIEDKIEAFGVQADFDITDREIRGPHDSLIIFRGLQNHTAKSIKSLEGFTRMFAEEAQTLSQRSLDLLIPTFRSNSELAFAWNSVSPKDPVEKLFEENKNDDDFCSVHVTFRDNPWFPEELRRDMERDKRRDPDKYNHIWLGGFLKSSEARVFRNWRIGTRDEFTDRVDRYYFGGDFGFSIDPTVLVRNYIKGRTLYIDREVYLVGCEVDHTPFLWGGCEDEELIRLNAQAFASLSPAKKSAWKGIPGSRKWPIIADSARPETISYLQRHGFPNVKPAKKGANSVVEGVEFLKGYDIVVHPDCVHTIDELTMFSFKVDPKTQEVLPVLVDAKNHVIDANRYAVEPLRRATGGLF